MKNINYKIDMNGLIAKAVVVVVGNDKLAKLSSSFHLQSKNPKLAFSMCSSNVIATPPYLLQL
jgi:hypothetical protein